MNVARPSNAIFETPYSSQKSMSILSRWRCAAGISKPRGSVRGVELLGTGHEPADGHGSEFDDTEKARNLEPNLGVAAVSQNLDFLMGWGGRSAAVPILPAGRGRVGWRGSPVTIKTIRWMLARCSNSNNRHRRSPISSHLASSLKLYCSKLSPSGLLGATEVGRRPVLSDKGP
jgi:hypothetical protein